MSNQEKNAYILGTDKDELYRLGLQHQVWASEAQRGWNLAQFSSGQTILDLGCGPGFCTKELAFITGPDGKTIGIDRSESYIEYLNKNNFHSYEVTLREDIFAGRKFREFRELASNSRN